MSAASGSCYITAAEVICTDERNLIVCNGDAMVMQQQVWDTLWGALLGQEPSKVHACTLSTSSLSKSCSCRC